MFSFAWIIETFTVDAITCICFHAYMCHDAYAIACFFYMLLNLHNACSTWCIYMTCFIFSTIHGLLLILPHKLNEDCKIWLWACRSSWNAEVLRCFVSVSITCILLETCWIFNFFAMTLSRTKWISNSMCFVLAWRIWLWDSNTVLMLSHNKVSGRNMIESSTSNNFIHTSFEVACVSARYSALVVEHVKGGYFFELYDRRLSPR